MIPRIKKLPSVRRNVNSILYGIINPICLAILKYKLAIAKQSKVEQFFA